MLINEYLEKIEYVIKNNDQSLAQVVYEEIVNVYKHEIKGIEDGTTALAAIVNAVWNLNYDNPSDKLNINIDYINDLKIIRPKLRKYEETQEISSKKIIQLLILVLILLIVMFLNLKLVTVLIKMRKTNIILFI